LQRGGFSTWLQGIQRDLPLLY